MSKKLVISEKYQPLFEWLTATPDNPLYKVDTVIETGGRYSQKSFATGVFSCIAAKDHNHRILYTRYTLTSAEDSIIPEFNEKIDILNCHPAFEVKKDRIAGVHNNSKIVFKGIKTSSGNQTASLKSLKDFSMFILEEAEEHPDFDSWDKIKKSIRALDVRNLNVMILNPATREHWVYQELFEGRGVKEGFNGIVGNILYIHTTYLDIEREFIPDSIYNDFEEKRVAYEQYFNTPKDRRDLLPGKIRKAAMYYKHVVLGGWLDKAEGVIFDNWEIGDFTDTGYTLYGSDFGFSLDQTTLVHIAIDKAGKRIYLKECLYKTRMTTSDIIQAYQQCGSSLIVADSAEPRLIDEVAKAGINIKGAVKGPGSITAGIALMQDYQLVITADSTNLIKELNNYAWNDKKSGVPIDAFNHLLDAARYGISELLQQQRVQWFA